MAKNKLDLQSFNLDVVPLIKTPEELQRLIAGNYRGDAHIRLDRIMVDELLSRNKINRTFTSSNVSKLNERVDYAGFCENIEKMALHADGRLADGQHRLTILKRLYENHVGQKPPVMTFSIGITKKESNCLDTGKLRTSDDFFECEYGKKSAGVRAALKLYIRIKENIKTATPAPEMMKNYWRDEFSTITVFGSGINCGFGKIKRKSSKSIETPCWIIVAFKMFQDEWGDETAQAALLDFYTNVNPNSYMSALRNYIIENKEEVTIGVTAPCDKTERLLGLAFYCLNRYLKNKKSKEGQSLEKKSEPLALNPNKRGR